MPVWLVAVGGDADAELVQSGKHFVFHVAGGEAVFELDVTDRCDRVGAAGGFGADLAEARVADVSLLDHVGDGANRVFDGNVVVEAGWTVDVDVRNT